MSELTLADALRLAINVRCDSPESHEISFPPPHL